MPKTHRLELAALGLTLLTSILLLRPLLIDGTGILPHDNYFWCYPIYHYFAENLAAGRLALWDPYVHGGEPFWMLLPQMRFLDPVSILTTITASLFSKDTVLWFNWVRYLQAIVMALGLYLVLRPLVRGSARLALLPVIFGSSVVLGTFPQDGILGAFAWVPWQIWFALRLAHGTGPRAANAVALGASVGLGWQSYHFAGGWTFGAAAFAGAWLWDRAALRRLRRTPRSAAITAVALTALMAIPNAALVAKSKHYVYPARMAPPDYEKLPSHGGPVRMEGEPGDVSFGWRMPYSFIRYTGGAGNFWDFLMLTAPDGTALTHGKAEAVFGYPTESYMYLGLLTLPLALAGVCFGRHRRKRLVGALTLGFGWLMLGSAGGLHPLLHAVFPPLWSIRNTGLFVPFVELGLLYFFALGLNAFFGGRRTPMTIPRAALFSVALAALLGLALKFHPAPLALAARWAVFLILPSVALVRLRSVRPAWASGLLVLVLAADVVEHTLASPILREGRPHPGPLLGVDTKAHAPAFPTSRSIAPRHPKRDEEPVLRYFPLLEHRPYALSALWHDKRDLKLKESVEHPRWSSFFLRRNYFKAVHIRFPEDALAHWWSIDRPLLRHEGEGTARWSVLSYTGDKLALDWENSGAGTLVWSDSLDEDWSATVDGVPAEIHSDFGLTKRLALEPGRHQVRFAYRPRFFLAGVFAFYLSLLVAGWYQLPHLRSLFEEVRPWPVRRPTCPS